MSAAVLTQGSPAAPGGYPTYLRDNKRYQLVTCEFRGLGTQLYRARDLRREGQTVAIKRLEASHISLEGFFGELGMMQVLNQRYPDLAITTVLDWFWSERAWYLVMQFVEGPNLDTVLRKRGRPLPIGEVLSIGLDLCAILSVLHTHKRPVIHRDIKPANVLQDRGGRIILADFGTACFEDSPLEARFRGTWRYAAPEQSGNQQITPAADVYGLGVTLYELLTGKFPGAGLALLRDRGALLPADVGQLLQQMLQKDVGERITSILDVERRLLELLGVHPVVRYS